VALNKEISLFVKHFTNTYEITINETYSVLNLKEIALAMHNEKNNLAQVDIEDVRLFFGGKELKNDLELYSYSIAPESIILMNIKPK
jgi:hypothetical protein